MRLTATFREGAYQGVRTSNDLQAYGCYCMADAASTVVGGRVTVYTPEECIDRALRTFFSGLTAREREQAWKSLEIEARQAKELEAL
jgi:hypothetical protein